MQRLHALLAEGAVGRPLHVAARWLNPRWADEGAASTWRMDLSQAGHGAMGDAGVHLVDMLRWNLGEIRRVCAQTGIAYPARTVPGGGRAADAEDVCTVLGELASGAQLTLSVSRAAHGVNEHALEVFGTGGALNSPSAPRMAAAGQGVDDLVKIDGKWYIKFRNVAPTREQE